MLARAAMILLAWVVLVPSAAAQTELRWQFKPGDVFYHEMSQNTQTIITVRDLIQPQELQQTVVSRFKVLEARNDGTVVLERRVEDVAFENQQGLPEAERIAGLMRGMTFTLTLDPKQRRVVKLDGYEDFMGRLAKLDEQAAQAMRAVLPPEAISASIETDFFHTPDKAVKKGDGWTSGFRMPMGPLGSLAGQNAYKYEDDKVSDAAAQQPLHRFAFTTTAAFEPPAPGQPAPGGVQFSKADLKIEEAKGTVLFDAVTGRVVKATTNMKFTATLAAEANGQPLGLVLTQTTTQVSRFLDKNPLEKK